MALPKPEEAPEPVPERKTSDEMIIEMAQSTVEPAQPADRIIEAGPEAEAEFDDFMIAEEPEAQPEPEDEAEEEDKNGFEEEY